MGMLEGWRMWWGGEEHSLVVTNQLWSQAALSTSHASANYQLCDLSEPQFPSSGEWDGKHLNLRTFCSTCLGCPSFPVLLVDSCACISDV